MNQTATEFDALKTRLKGMWSAGDFSEVAKHIEDEAEAFIGRLGLRSGDRVLDVACGSGNLSIPAARAGANVTGVDIAPNLVETARARAKSEGLEIKFEEGDAEQLPYEDNAFDVVVSMFGAMFAPRPDLVVSELLRVCRSGGRIAMANWTPEGLAGQMFKLAGKYLPPPDMPPPVLWGVEDTVRERFGNRVSDLKMTRRMCPMRYDFPPADVVEFFRTYFGPTKTAFESLDQEKQAEYAKDLENHWTQHNEATDGTTSVESEYLEVVAVTI